MNAATGLVVDALAVHRLTRLATRDEITEPIRSALIEQAYQLAGTAAAARAAAPHSTWSERAEDDPDAPRLARLLTCRWCMGWWIAVAAVWARRRHPAWWSPLAEAAALSSAAALLAALED